MNDALAALLLGAYYPEKLSSNTIPSVSESYRQVFNYNLHRKCLASMIYLHWETLCLYISFICVCNLI